MRSDFSLKDIVFHLGVDKTVFVSHIQRIGCQPRELLETVANPARGLLDADYGDTSATVVRE